MHDLVKSYSLAMARRVRHARQELTESRGGAPQAPGQGPRSQDNSAAKQQVEVRRADVQRWEGVHSTYRHHLETLSLTLHPFHLHDSSPADLCPGPQPVASRSRGHRNVSPGTISSPSGTMHEKGPQAVACPGRPGGFLVGKGSSRIWSRRPSPRRGGNGPGVLLPWVYWEHQVAHTRCARRKAKMRKAWEEVRAAFDHHAITQRLPPMPSRSGKRGPRSRSGLFSVPPRRWKAATVLWHNSITISGAYQSSGTRCGPSCITSVPSVARQSKLCRTVHTL